MKIRTISPTTNASGFSLFEVVLAVAVLSVSILALLGLFGPTMSSVRDVVDSNEANGVRTRLNAALMSDEIYVAYGLDKTPARFEQFAASLSDPTAGVRSPIFLYFWNEREDINAPFILKYSTDPTADGFDITKTEGSAFVVALEQGMQGKKASSTGSDVAATYDFNNVGQEGYFPILISIYGVPPTDLTTKNPTEFTSMVKDVQPLIFYTTAKLR